MSGTYGNFRGAILDFDMTIVNLFDSVEIFELRRELREVLAGNGFRTGSMRGLPIGLLRDAYSNDSGKEDSRTERWLKASETVCRYEMDAAGKAILTGDTVEFLKGLKSEGLKISVVSSNCEAAIESCFSRFGISGYFDCVIGRNAVMWDMKPSTACVDIALKSTGLRRNECFGLGDSADDIISFRNAGICPVGISGGVSTRQELIEAGAMAVVNRLAEVPGELHHITRYTSSVSES